MISVRVMPADAVVEVAVGEPLMRAAHRQGWWWPTICGGDGECGICWVVVEEGAEHCSPMGPTERATLAKGMKARDPRARLACQLYLGGCAVVRRRSVKAPGPDS